MSNPNIFTSSFDAPNDYASWSRYIVAKMQETFGDNSIARGIMADLIVARNSGEIDRQDYEILRRQVDRDRTSNRWQYSRLKAELLDLTHEKSFAKAYTALQALREKVKANADAPRGGYYTLSTNQINELYDYLEKAEEHVRSLEQERKDMAPVSPTADETIPRARLNSILNKLRRGERVWVPESALQEVHNFIDMNIPESSDPARYAYSENYRLKSRISTESLPPFELPSDPWKNPLSRNVQTIMISTIVLVAIAMWQRWSHHA